MGQRQEENGCLKCCLGILLAKISLQRQRRQTQERTEMDLRVVDFVGVYILHQVQDRIQWRGLANMAMKFRVAQNRGMSRVAKGKSASSSSSYFKIAYRLSNCPSKISAMMSVVEKKIIRDGQMDLFRVMWLP
jgi:hypothetical protein